MDDVKRRVLGDVRKYAKGSFIESLKGGDAEVPVNEPVVEGEMPEGEGEEMAEVKVYFPGHEGGCSCEKCGAAKELGLDADSLEALMSDAAPDMG